MSTSLLMSKIMDISTARGRAGKRETQVGVQETEKRTDYRRLSNARLFMQIVSTDNANMIGTTMFCETLDVSANGVEVELPLPVPVGAQLDLWIDDSSGPEKFFLSGVVRWRKQAGSEWHAGVELFDGAATDIEDWRMLHG